MSGGIGKFFLAVAATLLAGCGGPPTEPRHIVEAETRCAANGGLRSVEVHWLWTEYVEIHCLNKAHFKTKIKEPS